MPDFRHTRVKAPAKPLLDAAAVSRERPHLVRYAMLQVREKDVAEDLVQETLLAALNSIGSFAGNSSPRTWLIGILRHKISDHFRKAGREVAIDAADGEGGAEEIEAYFRADGHYVEMPKDWGDPEKILSEKRFFEALERCVRGLPEATAQAFLMRDLMGCETVEICKELSISSTNCWVLLHRARMRLRACLEKDWYGGERTDHQGMIP